MQRCTVSATILLSLTLTASLCLVESTAHAAGGDTVVSCALPSISLRWDASSTRIAGYAVQREIRSEPAGSIVDLAGDTRTILALRWLDPARCRVIPIDLDLFAWPIAASEWSDWYVWDIPGLRGYLFGDTLTLFTAPAPVALWFSQDLRAWAFAGSTDTGIYVTNITRPPASGKTGFWRTQFERSK